MFLAILICVPVASAQETVNSQPGSSAPKTALSKAIQVVRPSVVQVLHRLVLPPAERNALHLPSSSLILGTGFIVDVANGYIVTALHVIKAGEQPMLLPGGGPIHPDQDRMVIGVALPTIKSGPVRMQGSFQDVGVTVIARDARHDLALLKTTQSIEKFNVLTTPSGTTYVQTAAAVLYLGSLIDGDAIAASGYPLSSNVLITTSGAMASSDAVDEIQTPRAPDVADSYVADVRVNPGNSGGPMYLIRTGAVIGVCLSFEGAPLMEQINDQQRPVIGPNGERFSYNSGLSVVVPAKYIAELLKQNGVKFQSTTE